MVSRIHRRIIEKCEVQIRHQQALSSLDHLAKPRACGSIGRVDTALPKPWSPLDRIASTLREDLSEPLVRFGQQFRENYPTPRRS